jgi:hypothetical protein
MDHLQQPEPRIGEAVQLPPLHQSIANWIAAEVTRRIGVPVRVVGSHLYLDSPDRYPEAVTLIGQLERLLS